MYVSLNRINWNKLYITIDVMMPTLSFLVASETDSVTINGGASGEKVGIATTLGFQHYDDIIMGTIASQITSLTIVYSTVYSGEDQSKHQSSASLAFVWGIHRGPVNSPHKWPVTRKMFPFDDVIMVQQFYCETDFMPPWGHSYIYILIG